GLTPSFPADHDDHHGGDPRCHAADAGHRHRIRIAPAPRHCHHRRTCGQPDADAVHRAGHLSLLRSSGGAPDRTAAIQSAWTTESARAESAGRMNISAPFIHRPVATTLLTLGIALSGVLAFTKLPVAPLPQVDFPTIAVNAQLPGASPATVATSVASPLERHLGQIPGVTEMTSQSG